MTRLVAALFLIPFLFLSDGAAQPKRQRVIVLGFDGVDARYTEKWMNEGKLPNLARLRDQGTFRPLRATLPAQTPVSWSTFSTGIDPGRTGIFDFLRRDPKTYMPIFAAFEETSEPLLLGKANHALVAGVAFLLLFLIVVVALKLFRFRFGKAALAALVVGVLGAAGAYAWSQKNIPTSVPGVHNRRQGITMWDLASKAGLKAKVAHVPVTFPAEEFHEGHMLSGLGTPDVSGRIGKPFYFTSELELPKGGSGSNEFSIEISQLEDNRGVIETKLVGPPNKLFKEPAYISIPMTITVAEDRESIDIAVSGQKVTLRPGTWSDWMTFEFPFSSVAKIRGISRFHLISVAPEIRLYLSPINFDPRKLPPMMKVSYPKEWAPELAERHGPFKTIGWAIDTWAISEGFANEQIFWDDMTWTVAQFRKLFREFLADDDELLIQIFEFPDRVAHVFWRLMDEGHPAYDAALAAKWGDGLLKSYEIMDEIVGEAMEAAERENAALIVLSDHGFATYRKSVNYNTWLVQNGYLTLKSGVETKDRNLEILFDQGQFWENVDWSKTRAYSMGLGNLYINLEGREANGIVSPGAEYDQLKTELTSKLEAMVDPATGEKPVSRVYSREESYKRFDPNLIPDLFVTNNDGYRVSWQTSLGGIPKDLFSDNKRVWSGDHCSLDPAIVKGIFFYNRKLATAKEPYIADIYPTVLELLALKPPYELDGVALK
ncbi:MAG: alkaline phosphatase family protein [Thermoanaerobaculia bacterium]